MTKFTPGPWEVSDDHRIMSGPNAKMIVQKETCEPIALIYNVKAETNANIITAAPELLIELSCVTDILEDFIKNYHLGTPQFHNDMKIIKSARNTIKKARGE